MKSTIKLLLLFTFMLPVSLFAQGIEFDKQHSWEQLKEQAKSQRKYIFMDVMATWCGPCKMMEESVFSNPKVGEFFNKNFINIKLQTDITDKDNDHVKSWHKSAEKLRIEHKIKALPTFLFFSPDGELVHISVGAISSVNDFITLGATAIDPQKQIYTRLKRVENGDRDVDMMYDLAIDFLNMGDQIGATKVANIFLQTITLEERLSEEGLQFAGMFVTSSNDEAFKLFMAYPEQIDKILGPKTAKSKVMEVVDKEMLLAAIKDTVNTPNWDLLRKQMTEKYPALEQNIKLHVLNRKLSYSQKVRNEEMFFEALEELIEANLQVGDQGSARWFAHLLGTKTQNKQQRAYALKCLADNLDDKDPDSLCSYAEVLALSGKKKDAVKYFEKALGLTKEGDFRYENIAKIRNKYI